MTLHSQIEDAKKWEGIYKRKCAELEKELKATRGALDDACGDLDAALARERRYKRGLEAIIQHQTMSGGRMAEISTVVAIARTARADGPEGKEKKDAGERQA